ncbi:MAG: helix-turn-helix domain-containing protein [Vibrio fluvialis]
MNNHDDYVQILKQGGRPVFAVLSYEKYLHLTGQFGDDSENVYVPNAVAEMVLFDDLSLITAWRRYLKISQRELACRLTVTQSAVAQMEKANTKPHQKTLNNIARALRIMPEQLVMW